jgi:dTDP-4-amino-4,6-dideoxygalactose transaminase
MFYLLLPSPVQRDALITHLRVHGINSVFHYLPLHLSTMGRRLGGQPGDCPVTESVSDRLLRLPFYNQLSKADQAYIVTTITEFTGM